MLRRPPLKTPIYIEEVGEKVVIYNVMTIGFYPSSISQLLIIWENPLLESSLKLLPLIHFIRVLKINKDKPVKNQLKVIREDVLYTLNEVYQVLQVVKRLNQRLFKSKRQWGPCLPSNRTDQRLQHQALYGIEPLDWLMRRAHTKSPRKLATRRDINGECLREIA